MKKIILTTALLTALGATPQALANQAGDFLIRGGATMVDPDSGKADVYLDGTNSGLEVSVDDNTQLGLNFVYFYTDNIAVELLAATPFKHDINIHTPAGSDTLGETSHLPPTISALYYFNTAGNFKPYVGAGLNYTIFFDDSFKSDYKQAGFSDLELDNSFGFSLQVGADYHIDDKWHLNASARYIDISTDANFKVAEIVDGKAEVDIDPMVFSVMLGYKF